MAALAGGAGVAGVWEALAAVEAAAPARALARLLDPLRAGREPTPPERRRLVLAGAASLLGAGWLVSGPVAGGVLAAGGPWLVRRAVAARRGRRRAELARAAPAVARALADALAGGHAVRGALALSAEGAGLTGAAAQELHGAAAALALGERTEAVLERLRRIAGDSAWDTIVAAILLQREAGGDLAGLLRGVAATIDEARRAEADAHAATAQARFTAWLVAGLPAGAAVLAELAHPGYLLTLARAPMTAMLAGTALLLQVAAVLAIRRVAP
jgi:tight adherence protein B